MNPTCILINATKHFPRYYIDMVVLGATRASNDRVYARVERYMLDCGLVTHADIIHSMR